MIQSNIKHTTRKSIKKWSKLVYEMPCNRSTALKQVLSNCLEPLCYWEDLISCISFLLQHSTLTGDHFPQVPSATEGFIQCEPQFFSWQNTFQIWIPIIFHLKRMLTLRCMETTWPRPLSALLGAAWCSVVDCPVITWWVSPGRPANSVVAGFLHNNHEMWKIIHILMYTFDILVDVFLKSSLKKECWPQQANNIPTSFHFTT